MVRVQSGRPDAVGTEKEIAVTICDGSITVGA